MFGIVYLGLYKAHGDGDCCSFGAMLAFASVCVCVCVCVCVFGRLLPVLFARSCMYVSVCVFLIKWSAERVNQIYLSKQQVPALMS